MFDELQKLWGYCPEKCGLILSDNTIITLENIHPNPWDNFEIDPQALVEFEGKIAATWHTHPKTSANLSVEDYRLFQQLPDWYHYIIARDEVRCYYTQNNTVFLYESNL